MILVANIAAILNETHILLLRKRGQKKGSQVWILPGGKNRHGERDEVCLQRKCQEELPHTIFGRHTFFERFNGISPTNKQEMQATVYICKHNERLNTTPAADIVEARYFHLGELPLLSKITRDVILSLERSEHLRPVSRSEACLQP